MKLFNSKSTDTRTQVDESKQEFDSPWKKVIEIYFQNFVEFFFPQIYKLALPADLEQQIYQEVRNIEENLKMECVPRFMKFAKEEGLEEGIKQGIEQEREHSRQLVLESPKISLKIKFGEKASLFLPAIYQLKSPEELIAFQRKLEIAKSVEQLKKSLPQE